MEGFLLMFSKYPNKQDWYETIYKLLTIPPMHNFMMLCFPRFPVAFNFMAHRGIHVHVVSSYSHMWHAILIRIKLL